MLTAAFFAPFIAMCARLDVSPVDLLSVACNESRCSAEAHNPHGDASGLWQLMPSTARGLGWNVDADPHLDAFRALGAVGQLPWFEKYFAPHKGKLVSAAACYVATFLPALLAHAGDPSFVLCALGGPLEWAYKANKGFDPRGAGRITVSDLAAAIERASAAMGATWDGYLTFLTPTVDDITSARNDVCADPSAS